MANGSFETVNPATDEKIGTYELLPLAETMRRAENGRRAFESVWSKLALADRAEHLRRLASAIRSKKERYAGLITSEMGKPISQARAEVEKSAWTAEVYAENAGAWLREEAMETDATQSYVVFQPLGLVLSIMPWNFPFWQTLRFAIPTLVAGNVSLLRHSNVCPGSSLAIAETFRDAGFPDGVFDSVITDHRAVSSLIESDRVQGVSLTGSVEVGRRIGEIAGRNLKKLVLELGGSDPFVVLEDADVSRAAKVGANARLVNSGQSCIAAKRFIVVKPVAQSFLDSFAREFEAKKTGDPMDPATDVGPLVNKEQVTILDSQVKDAVAKGAQVVAGGKPRGGTGAFFEPTVLGSATRSMKVMQEEVFGPVAPVFVAQDEREAIAVANESEFGLGGSLWTSDMRKARELALRIESGIVFVNELVKSDPRMPFGGVKNSGIGRELSRYGLKEFVNIKSVNIWDLGPKSASAAAG